MPRTKAKTKPPPLDKKTSETAIGHALAGHSITHIAEAIGTQPGDLRRTLQAYFADANQPRAAVNGWCLEATRELYRRALQVGDVQNALKAVSQLHKMANE